MVVVRDGASAVREGLRQELFDGLAVAARFGILNLGIVVLNVVGPAPTMQKPPHEHLLIPFEPPILFCKVMNSDCNLLLESVMQLCISTLGLAQTPKTNFSKC